MPATKTAPIKTVLMFRKLESPLDDEVLVSAWLAVVAAGVAVDPDATAAGAALVSRGAEAAAVFVGIFRTWPGWII